MLGNANMYKIVPRHVKYANMFQVPRHAKMCKGVTIHVRDYEGNKKDKKVKVQGNEHIRGLVSHQFTFYRRGMLDTPTIGGSRF